ncbi:MAG: hypothetical protein CO158_08615 [Piscirickettsiaceae bacterium CG_4_9_14_3_um_filter_43_564]|nr:hypothetical protein [Thiomicrospira sp.]OIP95233.1 MAG: hypothetical protein AUK56_06080 [Thiomicrospira sp. CG2_30_44_34]PIQ03919.1 MAG: hypothetical protein COW74_06175 [Piscirickettsiaceae bacterium CG18_big_fil_WC_8_21_14_2_50_44_103]PIU38473.1 MAG: hypothetical protein COT01_06195 [Piscirickettsiaceae bacterium CG07_land_8_20_14_0_80_44_28]PIW57887.1 MAG: hypothetical protein COW14_03535 [Piscirickettsiaceae bacterium CG12_big_fil_rev_8_21_14_0_65_44_934]PIW77456.1 MAG: hypothetical p
MQNIKVPNCKDFNRLSTDAAEDLLYQLLIEKLVLIEQDLVPDLSHISHFASYTGGMKVDRVEFVRQGRFRLCYQVPWEINWSCADQSQSGVAGEKVHFTVSESGHLSFLWLGKSL